MTSLANLFLIIGVLAGSLLSVIGYWAYRKPAQPGRRSFVAFSVMLGAAGLVSGIIGLIPPVGPDVEGAVWPQIPQVIWFFSTLPWFVFVVQYAGIRPEVKPATVLLLGVPHLFILVQIGVGWTDTGNAFLESIGTLVLVYILLLASGGTYLLLRAVYSAGHLSLGHGIATSAAAIGPFVTWTTINPAEIPDGVTATGRAFVFAVGAGVPVLALGAAILQYDLFERTPSISTLGKNALISETDDLMLVVNDDDRIVNVNESVIETVNCDRAGALGSSLSAVLGQDTEQLRTAETVTVRVGQSTRQYDTQVMDMTGPHNNVLGAMISLRDVTERQLREQRLAVLNRVLRHNLRNDVDVIKGNAESLPADDTRVETIIDTAESIRTYGTRARTIQEYVSEPAQTVRVDIPVVMQAVIDTVDAAETDMSVSVESPASVQIATDKQALQAALESAIDNAVTYGDSTVTITVEKHPGQVEIKVIDDGPGIPEWETEALKTGTEDALQHSTGLGLWQLKWAINSVDGSVSFDTADGTTVSMTVPDDSPPRHRTE